MLRLLIATGVFSLSLHAGTAHAASGLAFSGSDLTPEEWQMARGEADAFLGAWKQTERDRTSLRQQITRLTKRRNEQRVLCRGTARHANRDNRFAVMQECWKTLLTLEIDERNMEMDLLKLTPPLNDHRTIVMQKMGSLIDALRTIMTAIDGSVYAAEEDLRDAKKNLWQTYRLPLHEAMIEWHADQLSAWVNALAVQINLHDTLHPVTACIQEKEGLLTALKTSQNDPTSSAEIRMVTKHILSCIDMINT